ncbi:MAG: cytochrome c class [Ramlibacter sp.]|nr:cytochrome c class [Ramlibacter sp.]
MKALAGAAVLLLALALTGCERDKRYFSPPAENTTPAPAGARMSTNQPAMAQEGGVKTAAKNYSMYDGNASAVNQGKRLYHWYNCSGCHAAGGGSIGPALMDAEWKYGSDPANIFASITQGRPDGMPSFGGHIPEDQAWMIVAYVRSMSGGLRKDVAPSRSDGLYPGDPENAREERPARPEGKQQ